LELKSFVFAQPKPVKQDLLSTVVKDATAVGKIVVVFFEADVTNEIFANHVVSNNVPKAAYISDCSKFWKQASVGTTGGRIVTKEQFKPLTKWTNKSTEPLKVLSAKYHTRDIFEMIKNFDDSESAVSSSSANEVPRVLTNKRSIHGLLVDLTDIDENPDVDSNSSSKISKTTEVANSANNKTNTCDDIQFIPVVKEIPMLDISMDDGDENAGIWSTVTERR